MQLIPSLSLILATLTLSATAAPQAASASPSDSINVSDVLPSASSVASAIGSATATGGASSAPSADTAASSAVSASVTATGSATSAAPGASSTASTGNSNNATGPNDVITYIPSSGPAAEGDVTFGENYAALFLDYQQGIVSGIADSEPGSYFLNQSQRWSDAVHAANPKPFIGYSRVAFDSQSLEVADLPYGFSQVVGSNNFTVGSNGTEIVSQVAPAADDFVFAKTRYSAAENTNLIRALQSQNVTTVVLSGIRTSGVILSTAYALFNADFNVFVISNTTIETPPNAAAVYEAILGPDGVIPKLPANVISIEQALTAIGAPESN